MSKQNIFFFFERFLVNVNNSPLDDNMPFRNLETAHESVAAWPPQDILIEFQGDSMMEAGINSSETTKNS